MALIKHTHKTGKWWRAAEKKNVARVVLCRSDRRPFVFRSVSNFNTVFLSIQLTYLTVGLSFCTLQVGNLLL